MRELIALYLVSGMIICGVALGLYHRRCPAELLPNTGDVAATVLIWPVPVIASIVSGPMPEAVCKVLR